MFVLCGVGLPWNCTGDQRASCSDRNYNGRMNQPALKIIENLADIPTAEWNALAGGDPILSHDFLYALQASGCATPRFGWKAQFLTLWQGETLVV